MMKRFLLAAFLTCLSYPAFAACAVTNLQVKDNAATTANVPYADDGSGASNCSPQIQIKQGGNVANVTAGNALKVDGSAVTQPANVSQFGGNNVVTGTGAGGSGIPRVTISNDSSLAANQSVNVNQLVGAAPSATNPIWTADAQTGATTMQNAAVANGNGSTLAVTGYASAIINVNCSVACSGGTTINFEGTDTTGTFFSVAAYPVAGGASVTTATTSGQFFVPANGLVSLRARISGYSAGTITVTGAAEAASVAAASSGTLSWSNTNKVEPWDGTTTATFKAASTGAAQTDTALVERNPDIGVVGATAGCTAGGSNTLVQCAYQLHTDLTSALPAGTNQIGFVGLQSNTTGGCTWSTTYMTGSANNSTLISTGAHTLCGFTVTQLSTAAGFLRFYDSASAPTCSSSTNMVGAYPVQSNATSPGMSPNLGSFGMNFANGLGFCFTNANGNNDNTNWAGTTNNVILVVGYK